MFIKKVYTIIQNYKTSTCTVEVNSALMNSMIDVGV